MALVARGLRKWEQIGFTVNLSVCLELQGTITPEAVQKCIKCLQTKHPYLRMGVEFTDAGELVFTQLASPTVQLTSGKPCYASWQTKLQVFANEMRNWGDSTMFAELASSDNRHQLFLTVNHAGVGLCVLSTAAQFYPA